MCVCVCVCADFEGKNVIDILENILTLHILSLPLPLLPTSSPPNSLSPSPPGDAGIRMKHGATAFHFFCGRTFEHKIEDFIFENVFNALLHATLDGANVSSNMGERPLHFLVTGGMDLKVCHDLFWGGGRGGWREMAPEN